MLFHRTLAPVVIRDWSPHLELFVGAVEATASSGWATPNVELLTPTTPSTYLPQIADYSGGDLPCDVQRGVLRQAADHLLEPPNGDHVVGGVLSGMNHADHRKPGL